MGLSGMTLQTLAFSRVTTFATGHTHTQTYLCSS